MPCEERTEAPLVEIGTTARGYTLWKQDNGVGGHRYWCDDIGGGRVVWDSSLDSLEPLLAVLAHEGVRLVEAKAR